MSPVGILIMLGAEIAGAVTGVLIGLRWFV